MNPLSILKQAWLLTWHTRTLWVLTVLLFAALLPAMILSGGFSLAASMVMLREDSVLGSVGGIRLPDLAPAAWIALAGAALLVTVAASAVSWILQAASIRAFMAAADGRKLSVGESLRLGWNRFRSILTLSLTFGVLTALLALAPPLSALLLHWDMAALQLIQSCITPLTSLVSISLFLVLMSIAVEDLHPVRAAGNAWKIFRAGWWGFLLVLAAGFLVGIAVAVVLTPILTLVAAIFSLGIALKSGLLAFLGSAAIAVSALILLGLLSFSMVFSTVLYSLTYRSAAVLVRTGETGRT